MDALHGATEEPGRATVSAVFGLTTNGVVKDEDARGSGAERCKFQTGMGEDSEWGSRVLQQLLSLGVVLGLDLVVVDKLLFIAGVVVELEAVAVERVDGLVAGDVGDGNLEGVGGSIVSLRAAGQCQYSSATT